MARSGTPARRKPRFRERNTVQEAPPAAPLRGRPPRPPAVTAAKPVSRDKAALAPRVTVEMGLYAAIVVAAFVLRFWDVGSRAMHGDESVHAWMAWHLFTGAGYQYDPVYHGPFQFPLTAFFFFVFGVSNATGRLAAVLFGTALVALPYFFRREMGRLAALIASILMAVSPAFVYDSRLERDDIFTSFFAMTMAIALISFARTRQLRYVYLGAASIALSLSAMENTYITLFVFGSFLLISMGSEYLSRRSADSSFVRFWRRTGTDNAIDSRLLLGLGGLLFIAFAITVWKGAYPPVPTVLALALVALASRQSSLNAVTSRSSPFLDAVRGVSWQQWLNALTILVAILVLFYSTFGTNLTGLWDAGRPFLNTSGACPGNSFPLNPCRKDIIGGLFYWLSQHGVHRGGQPWFYYSLLFGLYEQIAVIFGIAGIIYFARRATVFTAFLTYWAILTFGVYSWAGEKFPWLMIHPLLPFILLAAMFLAAMVRQTKPIMIVCFSVLGLLVLLDLHNTYEVNFVNGADPVEMMVYVQSSPDTPKVANSILALSNKTTNGPDMAVTIDTLETWPFAWYLRDMSNVGYPASSQLTQKPYVTNPAIIVDEADQPALYPKIKGRYSGRRYILRWWFPEDYKSLTWRSFGRDLVNPGYWKVVTQWQLQRRPFGPKGTVRFYYYVKNGLASPY